MNLDDSGYEVAYFTGWEVALWKVAAHLCLTLMVNELKISVEEGRVITT